MKLTKKLEKEIWEVYDTWLQGYLNCDWETYHYYLDKDYHFIGSTNNEEFLTREAATDFFKKTGDQLAGKTDLRNNVRIIESFGELVFLNHFFDAWFLFGTEWNFYGRFRFTNVLHETKDGWRFIYQHYSTPDAKTQEGETIGFEQISAENLQLREAIKRRTKELEEKNRELEIEAALERVRARSLAMHNSSEMQSVANAVYDQMLELGIETDAVGMSGVIEAHKDYDVWIGGSPFSDPIRIPFNESTQVQRDYNEMLEQRPELFARTYSGEIKKEYINHLLQHGEFAEDLKRKMVESSAFSTSISTTKNSGIQIVRYNDTPYTDQENEILKRFAKVFEQAYIRFMDLQKAEAQARTAQIETALERVRARSMAMHQTDELNDVLCVLLEQFDFLGINPVLTHLTLFDEANEKFSLRLTTSPTEKILVEQIIDIHAVETWKDSFEAWKKGDKNTVDCIDYPPEVLPAVWEVLSEVMNALPEGHKINPEDFPDGLYTTQGRFKFGYLGFNHRRRATEEEKIIVSRFATEFGRAYQRFLDIQKAEALAQKAKIEVALERVRARALAMQEPEELIEVAEVLRHEMGLLGVEELETCSIYINDEAIQRTECWYALKDISVEKKKLVSDHFPLNLDDTWVGREMKSFYLSDEKQVSIVMQGANRKEWIRYCEEKSAPFRGYYGEVIPDRTYHLYKFSHGAIGAAAAGDISAESWDLLRRAASVFSLAYSRFKDLTQARTDLVNLKEEKKKAEDALTNLKAAQSQLVQAEKMASLGELTAGIAHEIQNPLNFVNNFSEVSKELLDEIKEELEKGNLDEVKEMMNDVIQNLEKINHHGKRADGIVKGMLQHSRSSSGSKEPTDINALADEYLRLAYHGLRAKDKSFNATLKTDFDASLEKVNVIPQDMGRVILNLITNAFYVVNEKKKSGVAGYEPIVTVTTRKNNGLIEVSVRDNGNGIPQKVLDKIFQPFFTTKPTGQGTGLGLSLAYDIVNAHSGELSVQTKESEGTVFKIILPVG